MGFYIIFLYRPQHIVYNFIQFTFYKKQFWLFFLFTFFWCPLLDGSLCQFLWQLIWDRFWYMTFGLIPILLNLFKALTSFSAALQSGQIGPLINQFGLGEDVANAAAQGGEWWCSLWGFWNFSSLYSKNFLNDLKFVTVLHYLKLLSLHLLNFLPSEAVLKDLSHTVSPHNVEAISLKGICCLSLCNFFKP